MMRLLCAGFVISLLMATAMAEQAGMSGDAGRVLALETAWNHAIEAKDAKAIEMVLADSMVAVESDGSLFTKSEYLAGIKAPDFQPSQAVNEKNDVHVYGDTAVAVGIFRIKEVDKGKAVMHRERTVDTWMKTTGTWKCVAAVAVNMPSGKSKDE
jgi:ketosteroid isomerase-like protein